MPNKNQPVTAIEEAELQIKKVATAILQDLSELPNWKRKKGIRLEDRLNSGKSVFFVFKNDTTVVAYLGAKDHGRELGDVVLIDSMKEGIENSDNEFRLTKLLQNMVRGQHGGEVLSVLQQI